MMDIKPLTTDEVIHGYLRSLRTNNALVAECPGCQYVNRLSNFRIYDLRNPSGITPLVNQFQRQITALERTNATTSNKLIEAENNLELAKQEFWNKEAIYKERLNNPRNQEWEREIRSDALRRSKAIRMGQAVQAIAPWLSPVLDKYQPDELRVSNNPLDFIALEGLAEKRVRHIAFIEIKLNQSGLNATESSIKQAVEKSEVSFDVLHIPPKMLPASSPLTVVPRRY